MIFFSLWITTLVDTRLKLKNQFWRRGLAKKFLSLTKSRSRFSTKRWALWSDKTKRTASTSHSLHTHKLLKMTRINWRYSQNKKKMNLADLHLTELYPMLSNWRHIITKTWNLNLIALWGQSQSHKTNKIISGSKKGLKRQGCLLSILKFKKSRSRSSIIQWI